MSAPVFLAGSGTLLGYEVGHTYVLDGTEGRHAGVVQRRGVGERIDVVDGDGTRLVGIVTLVDSVGVHLEVREHHEESAPAIRIVLAQALAKGDRDELAIETATELGVDAVLPWQAERSIVVWRGERAAKSRARWHASVRAAAKQSRRARVPEVEVSLDTRGLTARVAEIVAEGGVVVVLHEDATVPLAEVALPERGELLLVVGPEGGISEREVEGLTGAGAHLARLGPHVLRTSTAGPVAIALLSERLGRWA